MHGETPLVTVGIPFRDAGHTLAQAIQSVLAQSYQRWELLLVDDGSLDGSVQIAETLSDPRIRIVSDGAQNGLVSRLNLIARLANGPLLARMDADDLMHPARLEEQVRFLSANPQVAAVSSWCYSFLRPSRVIGVREASRPTPRSLLTRNTIVHPTLVMRTDWAIAHPYDERFERAEDLELWCRSADESVLAVIGRPLLFYDEGGTFSRIKYIRTGLAVDRIYRRYAGQPVYSAFLRLRNLAKVILAVTLITAHLGGYLIRRRSRGLRPAELRDAQRALKMILNTPLPRRA